jgi:hypothetical protein
MEEPINTHQDRARSMREINISSYRFIMNIMGTYTDESMPLRLRCECGRNGCNEIINVTLRQRRQTRETYPQGFIVLREHVQGSDSETVISNGPGFVVVEKPLSD